MQLYRIYTQGGVKGCLGSFLPPQLHTYHSGTKFKITGVMVNLINESTADMNDLDFAEDWPQCEYACFYYCVRARCDAEESPAC